jgi:hypothetical protein
MKKFNLKKQASTKDCVISDKQLSENRKSMDLSNEQQQVVGKNINLSLPTKDKDNTIPFDKQLEASRKEGEKEIITEGHMDKKESDFNSKDKIQVTDINVKTEEYNKKYLDAFNKAEGETKKDTLFWDKYVGVQLEQKDMPTKVDINVPVSGSQLGNQPDRFDEEEVKKLIMASIKDADAMLFHIYSSVAKKGGGLDKNEKQQIIDINSGKMRLMSKLAQMPINTEDTKWPHRSFEGDVIIRPNKDGKFLVYEPGGGGEPIDIYNSVSEARADYPEGDIENG